jgi:CheY-like chemotaxis protein
MEPQLRDIPPAPTAVRDGGPAQPKAGRVLIVDDDRAVRELFRRSLELARFDVVVAAGGEEGLRLLGADPTIRVVLLDLAMPGMDGRRFRDVQRADPRLAAIPTMIVTGSSLAQVVHDELMADDYLLKPIGREHLVSVVSRYCCSLKP